MQKSITVIGQKKSERLSDMARAAELFPKNTVTIVPVEILTIRQIPTVLQKIKGVVLYLPLGQTEKLTRTLLRKKIMRKHVLLNSIVTKKKILKQKYHQQKVVQKSGMLGIPSFLFKNKNNLEQKIQKNKTLRYPFIIKKNISSQGKDVHLIEKFSDLKPFEKKLHHYVFQPFIQNTGDFRVFMIKNKVLGVMLRTGIQGEYRNNISLGGTGKKYTNQKLLKKIKPFAKKLVALFECDYAGVDLIYDAKEKKLRFMGMNFMPQWSGFTKATGIDVAKELLTYAYKQ